MKERRIGPITKEWLLGKRVIDARGCWLWPVPPVKNKHVTLREFGKNVALHRRAFELWHGVILNGLWVLHRCDVKRCFNPDHLFLGTAADNVHDCVLKGRHVFGERCNFSKLDTGKVLEIRASAERNGIIAKRYGVTRQDVWKIKTGQIWKELNAQTNKCRSIGTINQEA